MSDEIEIEARPIPYTNKVEPIVTNVPVVHRGRKVGTAEVDQKGHIKMTLTEQFDTHGIFQMLAVGEGVALTLGMIIRPSDG